MFCKKLFMVIQPLVAAWDDRKYTVGHEGEQRSQLDATIVTTVVRSPFFRAYLDFFLRTNKVVAKLQAWAGGCFCHEDLVEGVSPHLANKKRRLFFGSKTSVSPMSGKRLPELVSWRLIETFGDIYDCTMNAFIFVLQAFTGR